MIFHTNAWLFLLICVVFCLNWLICAQKTVDSACVSSELESASIIRTSFFPLNSLFRTFDFQRWNFVKFIWLHKRFNAIDAVNVSDDKFLLVWLTFYFNHTILRKKMNKFVRCSNVMRCTLCELYTVEMAAWLLHVRTRMEKTVAQSAHNRSLLLFSSFHWMFFFVPLNISAQWLFFRHLNFHFTCLKFYSARFRSKINFGKMP